MSRFLFIMLSVFLMMVGCKESKSKYAGTAEQAGVMHLQLCGKQIAAAVLGFKAEQGKWPTSLSELVSEGRLASQDLLYPRRYDLPDRRDILGFKDGVEWIYIPPKEGRSEMPLLIAPLPYTSSMGASFARPRRIVVMPDTIPKILEEDEIAKLIRNLIRA